MLNQIQIINPLQISDWDEIILSHPDYSLFHTKGWVKTIQDTYHYEPQFLAIINDQSFTSRRKADIIIN